MKGKESKQLKWYNKNTTPILCVGLVLSIANRWIESNIITIIANTLIIFPLITQLNNESKKDKRFNKWGIWGTRFFMTFLLFCWIFVVADAILEIIKN